MVGGFMAGVALGQKIVGMNKSQKTQVPSQAQKFQSAQSNQAQKLQSAQMAAYKRMQAHQKQLAMNTTANNAMTLPDFSAMPNFENTNSQPRRGGGRNSMRGNSSAENFMFNETFNGNFNNFNNDASGQILNSIKNNFGEINAWIKKVTNGLLDLNMSMALFFMVRGIRRLILEKQTPNAWQMIWWAMSILRGWRFV